MRRDIQALRGFSILVVLLYHAQFGWLKGGFLGVDIFFVISGFVITTKLMEGEGSIARQIKEFYLRRAKRILPASLTVSVLTALCAIFFLPAVARSRLSLDALSSALFSTNLHFARLGNDYLAQSADPSPFLHYWSLGVEEQFYLLWPILFLLFYKRTQKWLFPTLLVTTLFSLWFTSINPVVSFYIPFTRFWEFFAGIVLAMNPTFAFAKRARLPIALLGWATITAATLLISVRDATPGATTIVAILGAMLVIAAKVEVKREFLLPWLGDYSFSLYLVHWPIVVFFMARSSALSSPTQLEVIVFSLIAALSLTRFVEKPLRFTKRFSLSLPQWGAVVLVGSVLSFGTLASVASSSQSIDKSVPATYADGCHLSFGKSWPTKSCEYGNLKSATEIVLAGDSHAAQWFPALNKIAMDRKWKLTNLTKSSCPASTLETLRNGKFDSSCAIWQVKVLNLIAAHKPALVILSNYTEYQYQLKSSSLPYAKAWLQGESAFMKAIAQSGSRILYIEDTPHPSSQVAQFPLVRSQTTLSTRQTVKALQNVTFVNPTPWLCPNKCSIIFNGVNTYRDATHISVATSLSLVRQLEAAIPL